MDLTKTEDFEQAMSNLTTPYLVKFYAPWYSYPFQPIVHVMITAMFGAFVCCYNHRLESNTPVSEPTTFALAGAGTANLSPLSSMHSPLPWMVLQVWVR